MSQVEKFNQKAAKATKNHKDNEVIKETEIKNSTLEKTGQKVANKYGLSTEDIFMIIARDGMEMWTKMWNNSMENVVRETMRTEVKAIIKDIVQEELASAARGFMRGISMAQMENTIKGEIEEKNEEPAEFKLEPFMNPEQHMEEPKLEYASCEPAVEVVDKPRYKEFDGNYKFRDKEKLDNMITKMYTDGEDPTITKEFKAKGPTYNTMYQNFMRDNPGRGVWKQYVQELLNGNNK